MKIIFWALLSANIVFAGPSEDWLAKIRGQEQAITDRLGALRVSLYKDTSPKNRAQALKENKALGKKLLALQKEIDQTRDRKFEQEASDAWKNAVQQAKGLQDFNKDGVMELEKLAKNKD